MNEVRFSSSSAGSPSTQLPSSGITSLEVVLLDKIQELQKTIRELSQDFDTLYSGVSRIVGLERRISDQEHPPSSANRDIPALLAKVEELRCVRLNSSINSFSPHLLSPAPQTSSLFPFTDVQETAETGPSLIGGGASLTPAEESLSLPQTSSSSPLTVAQETAETPPFLFGEESTEIWEEMTEKFPQAFKQVSQLKTIITARKHMTGGVMTQTLRELLSRAGDLPFINYLFPVENGRQSKQSLLHFAIKAINRGVTLAILQQLLAKGANPFLKDAKSDESIEGVNGDALSLANSRKDHGRSMQNTRFILLLEQARGIWNRYRVKGAKELLRQLALAFNQAEFPAFRGGKKRKETNREETPPKQAATSACVPPSPGFFTLPPPVEGPSDPFEGLLGNSDEFCAVPTPRSYLHDDN